MNAKKARVVAMLLLYSITFVGCQPQNRTEIACTAIDTLRSTVGKTYDVDEYEAWIYDNLPLHKRESIEIRPTENSTRIGWHIAKDQYYAWLEDGILIYASIDFHNELPTQLYVACLGKPEYYEFAHGTEHGLRFHDITLYYPSLGLKIEGKTYSRSSKFPVYVDVKELPINRIAIVPTQELDQFLEYIYGSMLEGIDTSDIKSWPGSWDHVIVDIE